MTCLVFFFPAFPLCRSLDACLKPPACLSLASPWRPNPPSPLRLRAPALHAELDPGLLPPDPHACVQHMCQASCASASRATELRLEDLGFRARVEGLTPEGVAAWRGCCLACAAAAACIVR